MRAMKDFPSVYPNELPRLPTDCKVEFAIKLYPGSSPMSITPYCMAPKEIRELKIQLQEQLDKDIIQTSITP